MFTWTVDVCGQCRLRLLTYDCTVTLAHTLWYSHSLRIYRVTWLLEITITCVHCLFDVVICRIQRLGRAKLVRGPLPCLFIPLSFSSSPSWPYGPFLSPARRSGGVLWAPSADPSPQKHFGIFRDQGASLRKNVGFFRAPTGWRLITGARHIFLSDFCRSSIDVLSSAYN